MNHQLNVDFRSPQALAAVPADTPVLLALSGGADSRLLLELLACDARTHGYALHLAHVHHGIRGDEADRDEQFCRTLAEQYRCPLYLLHADVPTLAKARGESLELTARRVRYDYFESLMREHSIPLLATAHHADDNMETVLLRLSRGASAAGLGGIAPARPFGSGYLVRPLLGATRSDILAMCEQLDLPYVTDSTNRDTVYSRNLVRHTVSPVLEQLSHRPQRQFLRSCSLLREDDELLCSMAKDALSAARSENTDAIPLRALRDRPVPIRRRMLVLWLREQGLDNPELCHIDALLHLIDAGRGEADLPLAVRIRADGASLSVSTPAPVTAIPKNICLPLTEGTQCYDAYGFRAHLLRHAATEHTKKQNVYKEFIHETITFDTIDASAHWRARREGDVLLMGGHHRKLRKLQNAAHMPVSLRNRLPLLCDSQGILWAPMIGVRDGVPVGGQREHCLTVEICPDGEKFDPH